MTGIKEALYYPYKTIGAITSSVPFVLSTLGDESFLTIGVGRSFHVFKVNRLAICFISKPAPGIITSLQVKNHYTYVSVGKTIFCYLREKIIGKFENHTADILGMSIVGDTLLSFDCDNSVWIFNIKSHSVMGNITLMNKAKITHALHPSTYLNKFVFGFDDGSLELWNVKTSKLIYKFQSHHKYFSDINNHAISCLVQPPTCDVIGVGFKSGLIVVLNLKLDQVLFTFKQLKPVVSLSFRSDSNVEKFPHIVSACENGNIFVWDLGSGVSSQSLARSKLSHTISQAHSTSVVKLEFLYGEPVFISTGLDNSIKVWIFDNNEGTPRLLRSRCGVKSYPLFLKYFGDISPSAMFDSSVTKLSNGILSLDASGDLQFTRIEKHFNFETFSLKGKENGLKISKSIQMSFSYLSNNSWGNLVTIHEKSPIAFTWKIENKSITKISLKPNSIESQDNLSATFSEVTQCGNFALIGYNNGIICKFNLQSGLLRGSSKRIHLSQITGLFVDAMNEKIVSIDSNGILIVWDFNTLLPLYQESFAKSLICMQGVRDSGLIAFADSDNVIRVFDIQTYQTCRYFSNGHSEKISCLCFSPDSSRLLSSSLDSTIRVWDLASGKCVSWLKFDKPITSISFSSHGELLVSKLYSKEINVCIDSSLCGEYIFDKDFTHPLDVFELNSDSSSVIIDNSIPEFASTEPSEISITEKGINFSLLPKAYWSSIFRFEAIKNKSKLHVPKSKVETPFFLTQLNPQNIEKTTLIESNFKKKNDQSKILKSQIFFRSNLAKLLVGLFQEIRLLDETSLLLIKPKVVDFLVHLSPSELDIELQTIYPKLGDLQGMKALQTLLEIFTSVLKDGNNFEVFHAYLNRLMVLNFDNFSHAIVLKDNFSDIKEKSMKNSQKINQLINTSICLVKSSLGMQVI